MTSLNTYMTDRISNYAPGRTDGGAGTLQALRRGSGQAIRQRDYNALDPHATLVIVDQAITYLRSRRETLEAEATRLEGLRPILATPHWRKDRHGQPRYLYLIHPTQNPSTLPFDFAQDELRTGLALASGLAESVGMWYNVSSIAKAPRCGDEGKNTTRYWAPGQVVVL